MTRIEVRDGKAIQVEETEIPIGHLKLELENIDLRIADLLAEKARLQAAIDILEGRADG